MHTWLVKFTVISINDDERELVEIPLLTEKQSLNQVEEFISDYALSSYATYIINEIKYLGYPYKHKVK